MVERQWGEAEVLALVAAWDEVAARHGTESRATFESISERLRRLSVARSWWECQAKCRSLGLQQSCSQDTAAPPANYSPGEAGRREQGWEEEVGDGGSQRGVRSCSGTIPVQEGKCRFTTSNKKKKKILYKVRSKHFLQARSRFMKITQVCTCVQA